MEARFHKLVASTTSINIIWNVLHLPPFHIIAFEMKLIFILFCYWGFKEGDGCCRWLVSFLFVSLTLGMTVLDLFLLLLMTVTWYSQLEEIKHPSCQYIDACVDLIWLYIYSYCLPFTSFPFILLQHLLQCGKVKCWRAVFVDMVIKRGLYRGSRVEQMVLSYWS